MDDRLTLLVVDDQESILFALRDFFQRTCEVTCLASLHEVVHAISNGARWRVVITDLRFDSADTEGLEIIDSVRRSDPETVIVMLTAFETPETRSEALRRGARTILPKPYPLPELARLLFRLSEAAP